MEAKVLSYLDSETTVLAYLVKRLRASWTSPIVLATSNLKIDDSLSDEAHKLGIPVFRGDQENVLRRLLDAANDLKCHHFVRVYGSYPLTDLRSLAELVDLHLARGADYSHNGHQAGVPWGMECEVLAVKTLEKLLHLDLNREQLETATLYIRQNPRSFQHAKLDSRIGRPNFKVALETKKDLILLQDIVRSLPDPTLESIAAYLQEHPILAASNYESPPQEVGLEKVFLYPEKIGRLLNHEAHVDASYPISVELSLTNVCNMNCVYCSDKQLRKRQGFRESLDKKTLFRLFDDLHRGGTRGIVIEGGGEPTMHPDFEEIIQFLADRGMAVGLITNGTRNLPSHILSSFEWIRVSLDASTQDEFKALKGVDCFETVLSNISGFARHCTTVGVGYVVTAGNVSEVEALVLRLRHSGVSYVQFRPVVDCADLAPRGVDLTYLDCYQSARFAVIINGMVENAEHGNSGLPCLAHSLTTIISAEGSVFICGRLNIHDWLKPVGNIAESTFSDIWNGEERKRQASQIADPAFCLQHCPQCRITKFNKLISRLRGIQTPHFI